MTGEPKYPNVHVPLVGHDGNAFLIGGRVQAALWRAGVPESECKAYWAEATAGDYAHLLQVTLAWVNEGEPPPPPPEAFEGDACPECGSEDYYPGSVGCRACGKG